MPEEPATSTPAPGADEAPTPAGRRTRREYANGAKRRAEIVEAAFAVFAEQGVMHTSLREIGERAGTSHVSLIHHFGSKPALLQAVLERREAIENPIRAQLLAEHGLIEGVAKIMERNVSLRGIVHLDATLAVEAIDPKHPAHEWVRRRDAEFLASVRDELTRARTDGVIRDDVDVAVAARQMVSLIQGTQIQWLHDPDVDLPGTLRSFLLLLTP